MKKNILCIALLVASPAPAMAGLFDMLSSTPAVKGPSDSVLQEEAAKYAESKPEKLRSFFKSLYLEGEWSSTLNFNQLGLAAMELGDYELAKRSFDNSIARISSIYSNDPNAAKARSTFGAEKDKDWKGESYERVMAYYYRGILYARDGDYENAAASFKGASFQDTMSELEVYNSDFGLMDYMASWSMMCGGDETSAEELFVSALKKDKHLENLSLKNKFVALIDSGLGPIKFADGTNHELLKIKAPHNGLDEVKALQIPKPLVKAPVKKSKTDKVVEEEKTEEPIIAVGADIIFQAQTRGGRAFDAILNGKASFKDGANTVGDVGMGVGMGMMQHAALTGNSGSLDSGMFGMLLGAGSKIVANAVNTNADTRAWTSIPNTVYVAGAINPPSVTEGITVNVNGIGDLPVKLLSTHGKCSIGWVKTRSAFSKADGGTAYVAAKPVPHESDRQAKNNQFRGMLTSFF